MANTNATYATSISVDLPDYPAATVTFTNTAFFVSGNSEVLPGKQYSLTLDSNGQGTQTLPCPDNTGDSAINWRINLPSKESGTYAIAYSAIAQNLSDILAAQSTTADLDVITAAIAAKANKLPGGTEDNLFSIDANGDLQDSGFAAADFDAAGAAATAQAAAQTYAAGLGVYQGTLTRDFTTADLTTAGDYGYRTDKYALQIRAGNAIVVQRLNSYAINRALGVRRESMLAFWPMREQAGNFIEDYTGNGRHAKIITGAVVGQTGPGDGSTAIDTVTAGVDLYSASLAAALVPGESSYRVLVAIDAAGWSGGLQGILTLQADSSNYVAIQKASAGTNRLFFAYRAGGTTVSTYTETPSGMSAPTGFLDIVITISKTNNRMRVYINGVQLGSNITGLGTWAGNIAATTACAGCFANTPSYQLDGRVSFVQIWSAELTAAEVASLNFGAVVGFGDSITAGTGASATTARWLNLTVKGMGRTSLVNSGIASTVLQNTVQNTVAVIGGAATNNGRDTYATRVTAYNPEYVLVLYGLNDLRLDDAVFTAANYQNDLGEVVDGLIAAGVDPQRIVIGSPPYIPEASYALYSPYNGGSLVKHAQYVAACATVATAKGTKYIDVYQWMADNGGDALISGDGIHPNDAGHAQIAAAFLSVLI